MKFINYLEKVSGIDIYGLISLCMFVLFFTVMLVMVIRSDKKEMDQLGQIPLDK